MKKLSFVVLSALVLGLGLPPPRGRRLRALRAATSCHVRPTPATAPAIAVAHAATSITESQTALVKQYCATCHNDRNKNNAGGLTLASFDAAKVGHDAQSPKSRRR